MRYRRGDHRRWPLVAALVAGTAGFGILSGCSEQSDEAGFGLPTMDAAARQAVLSASGADVVDLAGTMVVEVNGCFTFRGTDPADGEPSRAWIVWPDTARQDASIVLLASGRHVGQGSRLNVSGAFVSLDELPEGGSPDSYFGTFGAFCDADDRGVLVIVDIGD